LTYGVNSCNLNGILPIFMTSAAPRVSTPGLAYRAPLLSGEAGTKQTIGVMRRLVDQAVSDANFVRFAIDLVRGVLPYNDIGEASAVYEWVKRNIRYTKDPVTKEKLYPPQDLLKIRAGDCDDISMLLGALMIALGYPARLITISANGSAPDEFSHVYLEAEVPPGSGAWVPMDAARLDSQFGVEPPFWYRKRAWSLTDNSYQDLSGGDCGCGCGGGCRPGLAGYATVGGLGQDGVDWGSLLQTSLQETPALIAAAAGQPVAVRTPQATVQTGPYASFQTPYTPGYGVPGAGYGYGGSAIGVTGTGWFATNWPWVLLGLGALFLLGKNR
jgi:Transglutaminase-like superfamily